MYSRLLVATFQLNKLLRFRIRSDQDLRLITDQKSEIYGKPLKISLELKSKCPLSN